jgi:perosamine synthetase
MTSVPVRGSAATPRPPPEAGWLRRQLPVYSPLPAAAVWRAARAVAAGADARPQVRCRLRAIYGADDVVLAGSGTQALGAAISTASRLTGSSLVALPAFTCFDVATAAVGAQCRIALYDIEPATLAPDLDSLAATLAAGASVVVVTPLYGIPVAWEAIEACAAARGALVIEDAAQGHGAVWRNRPLGSLGRLSVLSFGRGKGWTGGKGGALLVRSCPGATIPAPPDPASLDELRVLALAATQAALGHPGRYSLPASLPWLGLGETRYRSPQPATNMTRAAAQLVEITAAQAAGEARTRQMVVRAWLDALSEAPALRAVVAPRWATPGFLRLPLLLARGWASILDPRRAQRLGVAPGYPSTLARLESVRARLANPDQRWPGAEALVRELLTLPTHSRVSPAERRAILELLRRSGR